MSAPQIHLICGLTGAGKSTYAENLRLREKGVRFSVDEWNAGLFFPDKHPTADFNWFYERVQRCCAQMRKTAEQTLETGMPAVFDCGFTDAKERQIFYDWADGLGIPVVLHYLDVDEETRWARTENRNTEKGDTFALHVTRDMFEFMNRLWEAPSESEMQARNGKLVTT